MEEKNKFVKEVADKKYEYGFTTDVQTEIIEKGHAYHIIFLECTCDLCKKGYITTPLLCECSRQSVLYSLQTLWKERKFKVTLCHSILQGAQNCKMRIEVL